MADAYDEYYKIHQKYKNAEIELNKIKADLDRAGRSLYKDVLTSKPSDERGEYIIKIQDGLFIKEYQD